MILKATFPQINDLILINKTIYFNREIAYFNKHINANDRIGLFCYRNDEILTIYDKQVWVAKGLGDYVLLQDKPESAITILNSQFQHVKTYEGIWHLRMLDKLGDNFIQMVNDQAGVMTFYMIDTSLSVKPLSKLYKYKINNYLLTTISSGYFENRLVIASIEIKDMEEKILYKVDFSGYAKIKEKTVSGIVEKPNSIDNGEIFFDHDTVYVPMRGGQLVAFNVVDGTLKWLLEMEDNGFYAIYENRIYKISNWYLYEIDAMTGQILQAKKDTEMINNIRPYFTQSFKVYDDYILLKNQIGGWVAMINRKTFELEGFVELGVSLTSSADIMHWNDNKLYILDSNRLLHIYEKN